MSEMIKTEFKSGLELRNIFISNSSFSRKEELAPEIGLKFAFEHEIIDIDDIRFKVILSGKIESKDDSINSSATVVANFDIHSDTRDEGIIENLKNVNAIAIMFPYIRTQFTLIASQSGVPLILPPINIHAYFEDQKQKSK